MLIKLRVLNQFGAPEGLDSPDEIEVIFPGENGAVRKFLTHGAVRVLNDARGEIEVELSKFDVECMPVGRNQNFSVIVMSGTKTREATFTRSLHVDTIKVGEDMRKVIVR